MDNYTLMIEVMKVNAKILLNNRQGISLVYVVLVLLVMSILSIAIFTLFTSNMAQMRFQNHSVKVHFIAISGVEIAVGSLLYTDESTNSLLETYFKPNDINHVSVPLTDRIVLENGHADITISSFILDGEKQIKIESMGYLSGSDASKKLTMTLNAKFPQIQKWD